MGILIPMGREKPKMMIYFSRGQLGPIRPLINLLLINLIHSMNLFFSKISNLLPQMITLMMMWKRIRKMLTNHLTQMKMLNRITIIRMKTAKIPSLATPAGSVILAVHSAINAVGIIVAVVVAEEEINADLRVVAILPVLGKALAIRVEVAENRCEVTPEVEGFWVIPNL
jgi:hypothetical protein